jgi:3',5'-cyclic AMP phosphodiesterase CpdA
MRDTTLIHCSDLHFGHPAVPEQYEAIEALIEERKPHVVAISGDVSQRSRAGEFQRARAFIQRAAKVSETIIVPGNHDVMWWRAPLGLGGGDRMLEKYRMYISDDVEPVLRIAGVTIIGLNTAQGVIRQTLTWNMRDISIIGHLRKAQLERARAEFDRSRESDVRVIVMHHNPVKGELSQRHGLKNTKKILGAFAEMGVELVLCGHDHQEAVHYIEHTKRGTVISTAGTVSNRSRGGRPSSVNWIQITATEIVVSTLVWSEEGRTFVAGPAKRFTRTPRALAREQSAEEHSRARQEADRRSTDSAPPAPPRRD